MITGAQTYSMKCISVISQMRPEEEVKEFHQLFHNEKHDVV